MKPNKKYSVSFSFVLILSMFLVPFALGSNTLNQVSYLDNELSANLENASLGDVISEIQAKTGIEFLLNEAEAGRTVSVTFQALPLETALRRILKQSNHSMIFTAKGDIQKVIIVGSGEVSSGLQADRATMSSSSTAAEVVTPSTGDVEVTPPSDANTMIFNGDSKRDMNATPALDEKSMVVAPSGGDMKITPPGDDKAMVLTPPGGDMKVTPPSKSDAMMATHSGKAMSNVHHP